MKKEKADTRRNSSDLTECINNQLDREKNLYPLRISHNTVIYVTKDKCTNEYAESYRRRIMRTGIY